MPREGSRSEITASEDRAAKCWWPSMYSKKPGRLLEVGPACVAKLEDCDE